jgi:truncated hemoglobin YjbI
MNEKIDLVVTAFYKKAVSDFILSYQFKKIAKTNFVGHPLKTPIEAFEHHLPRIGLFWKNQLLSTPLPEGTPKFDLIKVHQALSIRRGEVGRWLVLFRETLNENLKEGEELKLKEDWLEKLEIFERAFLKSDLLFN